MFSNPTCHATRGAILDPKPLSTLGKHHFVNKLELMIPSKLLPSIDEKLPSNIYSYKMRGPPSILVQDGFLSLISKEKMVVTLVMKNVASDHQDIIGIAQNWLYLSLTNHTYQQSGLLGKRLSSKRLVKFCLSDLNTLEQNSQFHKLMWFLNNVLTDEFEFLFSVSNKVVQERLSQKMVDELNLSEIPLVRETHTLSNIKVPASWQGTGDHEILEWIGMVSLEANQLLQEVDPYISQYEESSSFAEERCDLTKITWTNGLLSAETSKGLWSLITQIKPEWSIIVQHGVPDCVVDYGASPHSFYDNGENVDVLLQNGDTFRLWEVIGGKSGH